ncbi:uncharacterized protein LOC124932925 [Impatiens glandulifera]|uniref:uncharacterized protein LOC124932925 n=1 Tax=Impatiens glandulifera TaxID=253017 RepID=UPI001FB064BC|nr:uncharacterized protein LOC124932925 [Impatiens glandulifera]
MAPLRHFSCSSSKNNKVFITLNLLLFSLLLSSAAQSIDPPRKQLFLDQPKSSTHNKNQTKLIKSSSSKNQTNLHKPTSEFLSSSSSSKTNNKTNLLKSPLLLIKDKLSSQLIKKHLNSTSSSKPSNSTKSTSGTKSSIDLSKLPSSPKNKTTKPISTKLPKSPVQLNQNKSKTPDKQQQQLKSTTTTDKKPISIKSQKKVQPSWIDEDDDEDIVSGLTDLPSKFQETIYPDFKQMTSTSKDYLKKANKEITKGMNPIVGKKYAASMASAISFVFIIIPLVLVFLLCNRIKSYFSLQKLLIFIQAYLAIYFSILCISSLVTGLEPLRFFYSTSQSTYICLQVLQTLAYVLYLLLLLMYLVLVFSTDTGSGSKLLGLAQTIVGYAVGLHYYMTVFHHVVLRQPPKTNWKVHGIYATCYLVICLLATADRTKKSYLEASGEENKKN